MGSGVDSSGRGCLFFDGLDGDLGSDELDDAAEVELPELDSP